jgi:predicted MPP superfamily phosphohydrolase
MFYKNINYNKVIIISDVHGCLYELIDLISIATNNFPDHHFVFTGDLTDRGPNSLGVIEKVKELNAVCVMGNHDEKLIRYLKGNKIKIAHGLQTTVDEIEKSTIDKQYLCDFFSSFPIYVILDNGKLVVSHAGIKDWMIGKQDEKKHGLIQQTCLYGDIDGSVDANGKPIRKDWAVERNLVDESPFIVYGHCIQKELKIVNKTCCVDMGCCEGGSLSALVYPEMTFISVPAKDIYSRG